MPKLSIYLKDNSSKDPKRLLFKINVSSDITLRQLIIEIMIRVAELSQQDLENDIDKLCSYAPMMFDNNRKLLWCGKPYTRSQLNIPITGKWGLNLKDGDALYVAETVAQNSEKSEQYDLALAEKCNCHVGDSNHNFSLTKLGMQELEKSATLGDIVTVEGLMDFIIVSPHYQDANYSISNKVFQAAIKHNQLLVAQLLMFKFHLDPNLLFNIKTPLEYAVEKSYFNMVKLLIAHGASLEPTEPGLLHLSQRPDILQYLLSSGAHPGNSQQLTQYYYNSYGRSFFKAVLEDSLYSILGNRLQDIIISYILPDSTATNGISLFLKSVQSFYAHVFKPLRLLQSEEDQGAKRIIQKGVNFYLPPPLLKKQLLINSKKLLVMTPALAKAFNTVLTTLTSDRQAPDEQLLLLAANKFVNTSVSAGNHTVADIILYLITNYTAEYIIKNSYHFLSANIKDITLSLIIEILEIETKQFRAAGSGTQNKQPPLSKQLLHLKFGHRVLTQLQQRDEELHQAVKNNQLALVEKCLSLGASLNASFYYDYPTAPIHLASSQGLTEMTQLLINCGAALTCYDKAGKAPLEYAYNNKNEHLQMLLIAHGATPTTSSLQALHISHYVRQFLEALLEDVLSGYMPQVLLNIMLDYMLDPEDYRKPIDFFASVTRYYDQEWKHLRQFAQFKTVLQAITNSHLPPKKMLILIDNHLETLLKKESNFLKDVITAKELNVFNRVYHRISPTIITENLLKQAINCTVSKLISKKSDASLSICMRLIMKRFDGSYARADDGNLINRLKQQAQQQLRIRKDKQQDHPLFAIVSFLIVIQQNLATPIAIPTTLSITTPGTAGQSMAALLSSHGGPLQAPLAKRELSLAKPSEGLPATRLA